MSIFRRLFRSFAKKEKEISPIRIEDLDIPTWELELAEKELKKLQVEQQALQTMIESVYASLFRGDISKSDADTILSDYKEKLRKLNEQIKEKESLVELYKLIKEKKKHETELQRINNKIRTLIAKIGRAPTIPKAPAPKRPKRKVPVSAEIEELIEKAHQVLRDTVEIDLEGLERRSEKKSGN